MENVNCLRCHFRHEDNGNCTAVGGFCTAVQAAHCPLLRQYLDTGMTPEAFQSFVVFFQDLIGNQKASEALDRFRQLAKADKDGGKRRSAEVVAEHVYFGDSKQRFESDTASAPPASGDFREIPEDEEGELPF
jgi:single-strand DNA-binding protein